MARRTHGRTLCHSVNEGSEMELGGKFWLLFIGGAIACALAGLLLFMASLPIKMVLRWTINLKYLVAIPEYFFNI